MMRRVQLYWGLGMLGAIFRFLLGLAVVVAVVLGVFFTFIRTDDMMIGFFPEGERVAIDFETVALKDSPNQYLVCPEDLCGGQQHLVSKTYAAPAQTLRDRFDDLIVREPRVERVHVSENGMQTDYVQRTELMQYPDWITVKVISLTPQTSTLAIYSRSVYGYGDQGVNKARIDALLADLDQSI